MEQAKILEYSLSKKDYKNLMKKGLLSKVKWMKIVMPICIFVGVLLLVNGIVNKETNIIVIFSIFTFIAILYLFLPNIRVNIFLKKFDSTTQGIEQFEYVLAKYQNEIRLMAKTTCKEFIFRVGTLKEVKKYENYTLLITSENVLVPVLNGDIANEIINEYLYYKTHK